VPAPTIAGPTPAYTGGPETGSVSDPKSDFRTTALA